jgi:hypothetical protein
VNYGQPPSDVAAVEQRRAKASAGQPDCEQPGVRQQVAAALERGGE